MQSTGSIGDTKREPPGYETIYPVIELSFLSYIKEKQVVEKVGQVGLGIFSAISSPCFFLSGVVLGSYLGFLTKKEDTSIPQDFIIQKLFDKVFGVHVPREISFLGDLALGFFLIHSSPYIFSPIVGAYVGTVGGKWALEKKLKEANRT